MDFTSQDHRPWIVAHRGAMVAAPENTKAAFDVAMRHPIDGIEFDVQLSRDGIPVVYHDETLEKTCGDQRTISDIPFKDLRAIDWGSWHSPQYRDERILRLEEAVALIAPRSRMMIEIKSFLHDSRSGRIRQLTDSVLDVLGRSGDDTLRGRSFVLSFDSSVLEHAFSVDPNRHYVLNVGGRHSIGRDDETTRDYLHALCAPIARLDERSVRACHELGKVVMTYSCNDPSAVDKAWRLSCDVIMTDRPEWIFTYLRSRGLLDDS